jgi:hypothetical protein
VTFALHNIYSLVFITVRESVYCAVRIGSFKEKRLRLLLKGLIMVMPYLTVTAFTQTRPIHNWAMTFQNSLYICFSWHRKVASKAITYHTYQKFYSTFNIYLPHFDIWAKQHLRPKYKLQRSELSTVLYHSFLETLIYISRCAATIYCYEIPCTCSLIPRNLTK